MMRKAFTVAMLAISFGASAQTPSQEKLRMKAMSGDQQAQRSLAHSYASPFSGERGDPVQACTWFLVILKAGSGKPSEGDVGNVRIHCGKLSESKRATADRQSAELLKKIYGRWRGALYGGAGEATNGNAQSVTIGRF
jgi:hypothetical protein